MALTEKQRKKIKEEEKYRAKIREELGEENKTDKKRPGCLGQLFVLFGLLIVIGVVAPLFFGDSSNDLNNEKVEEQELIGKVNFSEGQFHITNQESKNWKDCRFTLNGKYRYPPEKGLLGAETAVVEKIDTRSTYSIGASQFTLKDGTRFNIFQIKPLDFSISCENGFGYWSW